MLFDSIPFIPANISFVNMVSPFVLSVESTGRISTQGTQTNHTFFSEDIEVAEFPRPVPFEHILAATENETPVPSVNSTVPILGSVKEATKSALDFLGIETRGDLDALGGPTESGLYDKVQAYTKSSIWDAIKDPKASVRASYERMLDGYKIYANQ
tara:strand:- start:15 stop:482 length:468 start_codon:yes stop_codon:yes gene_type:complete